MMKSLNILILLIVAFLAVSTLAKEGKGNNVMVSKSALRVKSRQLSQNGGGDDDGEDDDGGDDDNGGDDGEDDNEDDDGVDEDGDGETDDHDEGPKCDEMVKKLCKPCKRSSNPSLCTDGCVDRNIKSIEKAGCNSTFYGGGLEDDDLNNDGIEDDEHEDEEDDDEGPRCDKLVGKLCKPCKKSKNRSLCVDGCVDKNTRLIEKQGCNSTHYGGGLDDNDEDNDGKDDDEELHDKCEKYIEKQLCVLCKRASDKTGCITTCISNNAAAVAAAGCTGYTPEPEDD